MLERVVGRMFRSAMGSPHHSSSEGKIPSFSFSDPQQSLPNDVGDMEIDNSQHVLVKIATLYAERLMNDICLVVGGIEYPAHRLILCASSEVFQVMLMNAEWSESHESRVVLQETPACAVIFGEFLRYFYTGQIKINNRIIMPVLALADKYNVKDLISLCVDYMCSHIAHAAQNNQLITWFQYTLSLGHQQVALACQSFLKWNFEMVAKKSDFANCSPDILAKLLQQNDLVVNNEMTLYNHVVSWLEAQREAFEEDGIIESEVESALEVLVKQVMMHVRFPMMTPRQLAELLLSPLTTRYKEFFIERMAIGMSFHSDQKERVAEVAREPGGRLLFTPRLYTAEKWSSKMVVEKFQCLPYYHTRTLVCSSQSALADHLGDRTCEWVIDLYPKGVWFQRFLLIVWQGTVEMPESVLSTVRLSITCRDPPPHQEDMRVKIGLLITGMTDGIEYVAHVVERDHRFSQEETALNIDDILPWEELNSSATQAGGEHAGMGGSRQTQNVRHHLHNGHHAHNPSRFLVGRDRDLLKLHVVIAPLAEMSSIDPPINTLLIPTR